MTTRTEVLVQKAMSALGSYRTFFVITYLLCTIRDAHLILVMEAARSRGKGGTLHYSLQGRGLRAVVRGSVRGPCGGGLTGR